MLMWETMLKRMTDGQPQLITNWIRAIIHDPYSPTPILRLIASEPGCGVSTFLEGLGLLLPIGDFKTSFVGFFNSKLEELVITYLEECREVEPMNQFLKLHSLDQITIQKPMQVRKEIDNRLHLILVHHKWEFTIPVGETIPLFLKPIPLNEKLVRSHVIEQLRLELPKFIASLIS